MATKGRTPKHPKPHKGIRNADRPNGKAWKKHPKKNKVREGLGTTMWLYDF